MQRSLLCALARGGISSDKTTNRSRSVVGNLRVAMDKDRVRHSRAFPHRHGQRGTIGQYFQELHTGQPPKFRGQDPPRVHISAARPGKPWFFVAHGACVLITAPGIRGRRVLLEARRQWRLGIVVSLLSIITYGAAMLAWRYGATARLAALRETSVLFGTALAMQFLGERMTPRRWFAACAVALGAILLQFP